MFVNRYKILALKKLKKAAKISRKEKPVNVLVKAIAEDIKLKEDSKAENSEGASRLVLILSMVNLIIL